MSFLVQYELQQLQSEKSGKVDLTDLDGVGHFGHVVALSSHSVCICTYRLQVYAHNPHWWFSRDIFAGDFVNPSELGRKDILRQIVAAEVKSLGGPSSGIHG